jgi:hypothetical protein
MMPPTPMIGSSPASAAASLLHDGGRQGAQRRAGKAARLPGIRQPSTPAARNRGVGGDDAVHAVLAQQVGNRLICASSRSGAIFSASGT